MSSTRQQKVAKVLKEELSRIFREEMNDPRMGFVSITDITVTPDMHTAHVYVSVFGEPEEQTATITALEHARGFLRTTLGREVNMRYTPELVFHLDRSIERGARIFELLNELKTEEGGEKKNEGNEK